MTDEERPEMSEDNLRTTIWRQMDLGKKDDQRFLVTIGVILLIVAVGLVIFFFSVLDSTG
ncbi:MAG: hypothetical protein IPM23_22360 [Candidatus Melainabacteria bacterium]|nr:hypothetical protein [Candidatus Melainabacteria bacterium]